jgi:hypothetical protein
MASMLLTPADRISRACCHFLTIYPQPAGVAVWLVLKGRPPPCPQAG